VPASTRPSRPSHPSRPSRPSRPARPLDGASCILLAASLWGTTATARTFAPAGAGPVAVGAARVIGGGLLLLAWALRGGALRELAARGTRTRCLLAAGAVAAAAYQTAFFAATARAGVAVGAVVTIGAAPGFTGVLSLLVDRRNRPGIRWLVATTAAVTGCVLLVTGGRAGGASMTGVALALLASFCYAVYATTASYLIGHGADGRAVVGAIFGGAAVLLLPVLLASPLAWLATGRGLEVAGYLAVLTTALAYLLYARGLRTTPVTTATTLGLAEPAIAAVLGLTVLGEHLTGTGLTGLGVLAVSLVILALPGRRPRPGSPAWPRTSVRRPAGRSRRRELRPVRRGSG
jgi:drug/metabolite transporter, DME family